MEDCLEFPETSVDIRILCYTLGRNEAWSTSNTFIHEIVSKLHIYHLEVSEEKAQISELTGSW